MANQLQEQISVVWKKTPVAQRITLSALILAAVVIVVVLVGWAQKPTYAVAFSGLSDEDASQITAKMDEKGIAYQLKGTGTVLVPSDKVYEVRLAMASEGLPQSSTAGYELFSQNMLGMTEFSQKVNYQRALEGELERTISSLDAVDSVSVNVVTPEKSLLSSDQAPTTASVVIKEKSGGYLDAGQVKAITNLVAYSVEGLKPENVVVVDSNGNLLTNEGGSYAGDSIIQSDSQRSAEIAAANDVSKKVQTMLDTILGPNRAAVQANVIMDWSQKEVESSIYDPTQVAVRSSEKISEDYLGTGDQASGVPGAESNLPTPVATIEAGTTTGDYNRTDETINYEISQTNTHEIYSPGQIKKISLAVMVDQITDAAQLEMIKSAVIAAAGIDMSRGDTVAVNTMEFDRSYFQEQTDTMAEDEKNDLYMKIGVGIGSALVLFILFGYFSKVMKKLRMSSRAAWKPILAPVAVAALQQGQPAPQKVAVKAAIPESAQASVPQIEMPKKIEMMENNSHPSQGAKTYPEDEQRARVISKLTEENPATIAEIIQIWLSEDEKNRV